MTNGRKRPGPGAGRDRTKYGPTPSRRPKAGTGVRLGLLGFVLMTVVGLALVVGGGAAFKGVLGDFRLASGLTGGSGQMHFGTCLADHVGGRGTSYECFGSVQPLSAVPEASGGLALMRDVGENMSGRYEQVGCTPTGTCVPGGTHAALGDAMGLTFAVVVMGGGLALLVSSFAARRSSLGAAYERRFRRVCQWSFGALGLVFVGLLVPFWAS
ncbi:hypothetical protein [Kitasatospora sp. McL0602]|uniref:hypothetical protein n=1 Tax=Kitasatospora sp. McL0602 TaxID=3439530 RepID=UPI003F887A60